MLYKLSPIQNHQEHIWACHKNGQGQPRFIIWKYTAAGQSKGTKVWCQQKPLVTLVICYKFQNNLFEVWCYTKFFHDFIHVYSLWQGLTRFWCQQEHFVTSVICCKFLKKTLWSLILYIFFHDFLHVYSPRAGTDSPQMTKFWCQQKRLVTSFICCKEKKKVFEVWFYTIFFMI